MGVMGTYCRLCGLPTQHDHYVLTPGTAVMKIYRQSSPGGGHDFSPEDDRFVFGPEHEWLKATVAVPREAIEGPVLHGSVSDGELVQEDGSAGAFVAEGNEDRYAFHRTCWEALGRPADLSQVTPSAGTFDWALVEPFQQQLFELQVLRDQGKAHMLADPAHEPRTRARIDCMAARARLPAPDAAPGDVAAVLARDRDWSGAMRGGADTRVGFTYQYWRAAQPSLERSAYPALLWVMKAYDQVEGPPLGAQLEPFDGFARALKAAVEQHDAAILVLVITGLGQAQYLVYARDEAATRARIDALPGRDTPLPLDYDNEADPVWAVYFEQMWPERHR